MDNGVNIPLICHHYTHKELEKLNTKDLITLITFPLDLIKEESYFEHNYSLKNKYEFNNLLYCTEQKDFFRYLSNLCTGMKIKNRNNTLQSNISVGDVVEINKVKGLFNGWMFKVIH